MAIRLSLTAETAGTAKMTARHFCSRTGWAATMGSSSGNSMDGVFLAGVIEGFYGQPWSQAERFELFDSMAKRGLNTYLYAPKDDLKHRAVWRELYTGVEEENFRELIRRCKERGIRFVYGLSPGLDIRYDSRGDLDRLKKRFEQMRGLGCEDFALLFDDIPRELDAALAAAQCEVANALSREGHGHLLFCPTAYCGRHRGEAYLSTLGHKLAPEIDVFWTGPEIISPEITVAHVKQVQKLL